MKKNIKNFVKKTSTAIITASLLLASSAAVISESSGIIGVSISASAASVEYYPRCNSGYGSIVDALRSIGVNASYENRKAIAQLNGYSSYTGSASQNTGLLNLLKQGKLIKSKTGTTTTSSSGSSGSVSYYPKCSSGYGSIVDALRSIRVNASFENRKAIAQLNGYSSYTGSASQNTGLLNLLKQGRLIKSKSGASSNTSQNTNNTSSSGNSSTNSAGSGLTYNPNGNISVSNKAKENKPFYTNSGKRSASAYNTVIDQFRVDSNSRYKRNSNGTYCNIFAWDVMSAMNVSLPHWIKNNAPATSSTKGAYEINVNATYNWIGNYGSNYGWKKVSASEAQNRANKGCPTIAIWKNPSGASGHVMVVRPEGKGYKYSSANGPVIAQAGATNVSYTNVKNTMGSKVPIYYTHD